jgi:hypothetical protein
VKVPKQCPLVLLVKVAWKGGKTFGCEESRNEKWSKEREREMGRIDEEFLSLSLSGAKARLNNI